MSRPLRLHVAGGFYHVTLRGNHRQPIFRTPMDRELLDRLVGETVTELGARVHAYCWMPNHIHLLVQVSNVPLGKLLMRIASRYARKHQQQLNTTGHLFERRYHAVLVDADAYLLTLLRYIHLNPVRAGLVADPAAYPWSSHHEYLGRRRVPWVCTKFALAMLASDPSSATRRYLAWMGDSGTTRWGEGALKTHAESRQVLGDDVFLERIALPPSRPARACTLDDLLAECSRRFGVSPEVIVSKSRARTLSAARAWLSRQAVSRGIATTSSVARHLDRSEAAIRGLVMRHPVAPDDQ
jgi:REP element-mobilizing transposase RayT